MAISVETQKISQTEAGFRVEATFVRTALFANDQRFKVRILGNGQFPEDRLELYLDRIATHKDQWRQGKRYKTYRLSDIYANVVILKHETIAE